MNHDVSAYKLMLIFFLNYSTNQGWKNTWEFGWIIMISKILFLQKIATSSIPVLYVYAISVCSEKLHSVAEEEYHVKGHSFLMVRLSFHTPACV